MESERLTTKETGRITRRQFIISAGGLALALGLSSACQPAPTPSPTEAGKAAPATAAAKVPATGTRTLTLAQSLVPQNLDRELNTSDQLMQQLNMQCVDVLAEWKRKARPDGNYDFDFSGVEPVLAESWDITDGGRTLVWHLRKGVKSPKGNELTAEVMKWTYDRCAAMKGNMTFHLGTLGVESPDGIKVLGKYDLSLTASRPSSLWLSNAPQHFAGPLDAVEYQAHATASDPLAQEFGRQNVVGFGPYQIESRTVGQECVLVPNPNYWRGRTTFDRIVWKEVPDPGVRYQLLLNGEADIAGGLTYRQRSELKGKPGVKHLSFLAGDLCMLSVQCQHTPLNDKRVRQALTWAIPYDDIQKSIYYGLTTPLYGPVPQMTKGFDKSLWPYRQDLDKARALLKEAGLSSGFQTTLTYPIGLPEDEPLMMLLQSAYKQIGVEARLEKLTPAAENEKLFTYKHDLGLSHGGANNPDPFYLFYLFWKSDSFINMSRWSNAEVDKLILDGLVSQNEDERMQESRRIQQIIIDECPYLYLTEPGYQLSIRDNISGAFPRMNREIYYDDLKKA